MSRDDPHFRLRLPADLKDRIQAAAAANKRSANAEIVAALMDAFPEPGVGVGEVVLAVLQDGIPRKVLMGGEITLVEKIESGVSFTPVDE